MNANKALQDVLNNQQTVSIKKLKRLLREAENEEIKALQIQNERLTQSKDDYKRKWDWVRKKNRKLKQRLEAK